MSSPYSPLPTSSLPEKLIQWRWRIFAATWLSYFGFYFCRKPFYIVKSALASELNISGEQLGTIGAAYLVAYTIGQFAMGALGQQLGARVLLLGGMGLSILLNIGMGLSGSFESLLLLMALNGLAQASGWSGNVGTMAAWFGRAERGRVMGIWATNFQAGGVAANALAAFVLSQNLIQWSILGGALVLRAQGYQGAFFAGAAVLGLIWTFFFVQPAKPS
jgi:sugar phosphate permease